jgi:hypothetical protein
MNQKPLSKKNNKSSNFYRFVTQSTLLFFLAFTVASQGTSPTLSNNNNNNNNSSSLIINSSHDSRKLASDPFSFVRDFKGDRENLLSDWLPNAPGDTSKAVLKFAFVLNSNGQIDSEPYFLNPNTYSFHWQFINDLNNSKTALSFREVEKMSFYKEGRQYIFGALMAYNRRIETDLPIRTSFQLTTEELLPVATISQIQKALENAGVKHHPEENSGAKGLDFVPTGTQKSSVETIKNDFAEAGIPLVLDQGTTQTSYTTGWGVGKFRYIMSSELQNQTNTIDPNTILLIDSAVNDIPQVAGIITTEALTPASHLVFLAQMYGIPLVYFPPKDKDGKPSIRIEDYKKLNGRWTFIETDQSTNRFELVSDFTEDEAKYLLNLKPKLKLDLEAFNDNGEAPVIKPVSDLNWDDIKTYGAKAVQMGVIFKTLEAPFHHEMAVGIPIAFYKRHLQKIESKVKNQLESLGSNASFNEVTQIAKNIQELIRNEPILSSDLQYTFDSLKFYFKDLTQVKAGQKVKLKLRSSSNVEDGEQFNGAGLYDSKGLCVFNCKAELTDEKIKLKLEETIKYVWASLYNPNAFWARRQFAISNQDELQKVGMGINVNPSVKNEIVNGVVSARIVDGDDFEVTVVEAKDGDEGNDSVQGENTKKQITHGGGEYGITKVTSPLANANDIFDPLLIKTPQLMPKQRYLELHQQMHRLFLVYKQKFSNSKNLVIEGEFKLRDHDAPVLLKQVRRVPATPEISLANNSKYLLLGGIYHFKVANANESGLGLAQLLRPNQVEIQIPTISSKELASGKLTAAKIIASGTNKSNNEVLSETCTQVKSIINFTKDETNKRIDEIKFNCKAPQLGSIVLSFKFNSDGSNSKLRLLNSPLLYSTLQVPAVFEAKISPSAATQTVFELQSELPETAILNSAYCMYSERIDEEEFNCNDKVSNELTEFGKKSKSKVFFKFQVQPIFGQYDRMTSEITKIEFFKRDKNNQWIHEGTYNLKSQFTYVFEALHDGFTQVFIDLEKSSPELYKKLSALKFTQNYLWSPLDSSSQMYFIGTMNGKKENIIGLDGLPKTVSR